VCPSADEGFYQVLDPLQIIAVAAAGLPLREIATHFDSAREAIAAAPPRAQVLALHQVRGKVRRVLWCAEGDELLSRPPSESAPIPWALLLAALTEGSQ
jgi:hypothetical protein